MSQRSAFRLARRFLALPVALGLAWTAAAPGYAQTAPATSLPAANAPTTSVSTASVPRSYMNKNVINLPILLDNQIRPQLQEVQLYVRDGETAPWVLKERVPPTQTFFTYRAPGEGEYHFSVVTVDRMGRNVPADVAAEPPALIVHVDQTGPLVDLHLLESSPLGQQVQSEVTDSNKDADKTQCSIQTADKVWRPLEAVPQLPGQFLIPAQARLSGLVRIQATDKAGNSTTREFNLQTMLAAAPKKMAPTAFPPELPPVDAVPLNALKSEGPALIQTADVPPGRSLKGQVEVVRKVSATNPVPAGPSLEQGPVLEPALHRTPSVEVFPRDGKHTGPAPFVAPPSLSEARVEPLSTDVTPVNKHVVNNTQVFLDYQIDQAGASGVGKVEIWVTRDQGQAWAKVGEDKDLKSPAEVTLPNEGLFGVSLVLSNGRGFGASPPQAGDQPDYWIDVDVTRPQAEIQGVRPGGTEDGALFIAWNAKDKKLAAEPVDLYFSTAREGTWNVIAKSVPNSGSFRWIPPRDVAAHAFIRLVVRDQAGNVTTCETVQPVALDDLSRPRGRVLGVSTVRVGTDKE